MTSLRPRIHTSAPGTTGRAPDVDYPVAYPMASTRMQRLACSLGVGRPLGARTISRTSRSLPALASRNRIWRYRAMVHGIVGGQAGGCLPVALINLPATLPCTYIPTAPTDEPEGGGS
jgi:hypothetical protein